MKNDRSGFTLVEMVVAIGLFSVVVSIAVGGLANVLKTQRQASEFLSANSNASLVLEQMSREMRTGYDFCTNGQLCPNESTLSFKNAKMEVVTYCLSGEALFRGVGAGSCGAGNFRRMTATNVAVKKLTFSIGGNSLTDLDQSQIAIAVGIAPTDPLAQSVVNLQITVSPRILDYAEGMYQGSYQSSYEAGYESYYQGPYYSEGAY